MLIPMAGRVSGNSPTLQAVIDQMSSAPTEARARIYDDKIIRPLIQGGVWSKLDLFYILASHHTQAATLNWKAPTTFALTATGTPTFTTDRGMTYDGSTNYHDTAYRWETAGLNGALDSHFMAGWSRTSGTTTNGCFGGVQTTGATTVAALNPRNASDNFTSRINDATTFNNANTDGTGFYGASRTASNVKRAFKNGSQIGADQTTASTTGADFSYIIGGVNSGAPGLAAREIAFAAAGGGLTVAEMATLYSAVNDYLTAVGAA